MFEWILIPTVLVVSVVMIGKFKIVERLVNLNADSKRLWFEELRNVNDGKMIDSMPISMTYFNKH